VKSWLFGGCVHNSSDTKKKKEEQEEEWDEKVRLL